MTSVGRLGSSAAAVIAAFALIGCAAPLPGDGEAEAPPSASIPLEGEEIPRTTYDFDQAVQDTYDESSDYLRSIGEEDQLFATGYDSFDAVIVTASEPSAETRAELERIAERHGVALRLEVSGITLEEYLRIPPEIVAASAETEHPIQSVGIGPDGVTVEVNVEASVSDREANLEYRRQFERALAGTGLSVVVVTVEDSFDDYSDG